MTSALDGQKTDVAVYERDLVVAIACLALAGVILTLFLLASALAQLDDARPAAQYGLPLWWARHRLIIRHCAEFGAIVAFLACGACLLVAVVSGNAAHVASPPPLRVPTPTPAGPGVVIQGQALANWTWYIAAIGIPIIVAILVWIAWRQFQIVRNKQKLRLFDRRMQVYATVGEALPTIARQGNHVVHLTSTSSKRMGSMPAPSMIGTRQPVTAASPLKTRPRTVQRRGVFQNIGLSATRPCTLDDTRKHVYAIDTCRHATSSHVQTNHRRS